MTEEIELRDLIAWQYKHLSAVFLEEAGKLLSLVEMRERGVERMAWQPNLDELKPDIERMIAAAVQPRIDPSNVTLQGDELAAECWTRLARLLADPSKMTRLKTRGKFFAYLKVMFRNHICTIVQKNVYTIKRGGGQPRQAGAELDFEHDRHVTSTVGRAQHVRIDDPDSHFQLEAASPVNGFWHEQLDELRVILTEGENLVLNRYLHHCCASGIYAQLRATIGSPVLAANVHITAADLARGVFGDWFTVSMWNSAMKSIKRKARQLMEEFRKDDDEERRRQAAEVTLCDVFGLQVPPTIDAQTRRRLYTLTARAFADSDKITEDVKALLRLVGAEVPGKISNTEYACFGVLWQRNHKICNQCCMEKACKTKAMNLGLGEFNLDPKVFGKSLTKIPVFAGNALAEEDADQGTSGVIPINRRDYEILQFLQEHYQQRVYDGAIYFTLRTGGNDRALPICVGSCNDRMILQFRSPSDQLKESLKEVRVGTKSTWYAHDYIGVEEAIELINDHMEETNARASANE